MGETTPDYSKFGWNSIWVAPQGDLCSLPLFSSIPTCNSKLFMRVDFFFSHAHLGYSLPFLCWLFVWMPSDLSVWFLEALPLFSLGMLMLRCELLMKQAGPVLSSQKCQQMRTSAGWSDFFLTSLADSSVFKLSDQQALQPHKERLHLEIHAHTHIPSGFIYPWEKSGTCCLICSMFKNTLPSSTDDIALF